MRAHIHFPKCIHLKEYIDLSLTEACAASEQWKTLYYGMQLYIIVDSTGLQKLLSMEFISQPTIFEYICDQSRGFKHALNYKSSHVIQLCALSASAVIDVSNIFNILLIKA